ncbi:MAG: AlpA family phage regulatory protein [Gammaproteobacteria bacterium]
MSQVTPPRIEKNPEVRARIGISRSTLYRKIQEGTFPAPISLGGRATGWLDHEVTAWINAMAAGKSDEDIRKLVKSLVAIRHEGV